MNIPPEVLLLIGISVCGSAVALAAFVWAVNTGQMDETESGALAIFDEGEPEGAQGQATGTGRQRRRSD